MRFFDALTVALLAGVLSMALFRPTRWRFLAALLLGGATIACFIHLSTEHSRWQMWPAYTVLIAACVAAALLRWQSLRAWFTAHGRARAALVILAGVVLALTPLASWMFPLFNLPPPSGAFGIGTTEFHFVDNSRREMHKANPINKRELIVRVWYPAEIDPSLTPAVYWPHAAQMAPAINESVWPFGSMLRHLDQIPTHAFTDAPVAGSIVTAGAEPQAPATYPVLVFSFGLGMGYAGQNTALMEELASRGYVIFAIEHAYDGLATVFPDGHVATFAAEGYEGHDPEPSAQFLKEAEGLMNSQDIPALLEMLPRIIKEQPGDSEVGQYWFDVWSKDQRFVMDQIEQLQSGALASQLAGHLQLDRLGVFGMSFGGSASAATCAVDSRCKAGMNLDGFRAVSIRNPPQQSPFMYFSNEMLSLNIVFLAQDLNDRYFVKVHGSQHWDFTDFPLLSPLVKLLGETGSIDTQRMLSLTNAYVAAFFDQYLAGKPSALLQGSSKDYPEVQLVFRKAASVGPAG